MESDIVAAVRDSRGRADDYDLFRDYDKGQHRARFASEAFRSKYEWLVQAGVVNLCPRIVANFADLCRVESWAGSGADAAAQAVDEHDLDGVLGLVVREALTAGDAYLNVWPGRDGRQRVWFHRADQAGFLQQPDDPASVRLFYQRFPLVEGRSQRDRINLYYPDGTVARYVTTMPVELGSLGPDVAGSTPVEFEEGQWAAYDEDGQPAEYRNEAKRLTWAHFAFDADTQGGHGRSILRDAIPVQDGLNHAYHSLLVSTERFARPLRGVLNYDPQPRLNPETGEMERQVLRVDETRDSFLGLDGKGPVFEWAQADPSGLRSLMEAYGAWMARTVGMPITDLIPDLGNVPSGAALRLLAKSRTATVQSFTRDLTDPVSRVLDLLGVVDVKPIWADPSPVDDSEMWERAQIKQSLGYSLADIITDLGEPDVDGVLQRAREAKADDAKTMAQAFLDGRGASSYGG